MKNWKTRLLMMFAMLAMVLAVSMPAVAVDLDDLEDAVEEEFDDAGVDADITAICEDEDGDGQLDEDADNCNADDVVFVVEFDDDFDGFDSDGDGFDFDNDGDDNDDGFFDNN
jgi:hypothetical protein